MSGSVDVCSLPPPSGPDSPEVTDADETLEMLEARVFSFANGERVVLRHITLRGHSLDSPLPPDDKVHSLAYVDDLERFAALNGDLTLGETTPAGVFAPPHSS